VNQESTEAVMQKIRMYGYHISKADERNLVGLQIVSRRAKLSNEKLTEHHANSAFGLYSEIEEQITGLQVDLTTALAEIEFWKEEVERVRQNTVLS
jgi:hypothetical protein